MLHSPATQGEEVANETGRESGVKRIGGRIRGVEGQALHQKESGENADATIYTGWEREGRKRGCTMFMHAWRLMLLRCSSSLAACRRGLGAKPAAAASLGSLCGRGGGEGGGGGSDARVRGGQGLRGLHDRLGRHICTGRPAGVQQRGVKWARRPMLAARTQQPTPTPKRPACQVTQRNGGRTTRRRRLPAQPPTPPTVVAGDGHRHHLAPHA